MATRQYSSSVCRLRNPSVEMASYDILAPTLAGVAYALGFFRL